MSTVTANVTIRSTEYSAASARFERKAYDDFLKHNLLPDNEDSLVLFLNEEGADEIQYGKVTHVEFDEFTDAEHGSIGPDTV